MPTYFATSIRKMGGRSQFIPRQVMHALLGLLMGVLATAAMCQSQQSSPQMTYSGRAAVPKSGQALLSDAQIKAQYQNCPQGHYQGYRPGRERYVKDRYLWAVTAAFARQYCMPAELVSHELQGAEAVAFRMVPGGFGENCSFDGQSERCGQGTDLRFEIYIRRDVKLPVKNDVDFTAPSRAHWQDSYSLIGHSNETQRISRERFQKNPAAWTLDRFDLNAFGLLGVQGDQVSWPIATLYLDEYRGKLYDGTLDYIALQGSSGHFRNERMLKLGIQDFVIAVDHFGEKRPAKQIPMNQYAHIIRLPKAFSAQVQAMDLGDKNGVQIPQKEVRPQ